jgi:hypothetical protein
MLAFLAVFSATAGWLTANTSGVVSVRPTRFACYPAQFSTFAPRSVTVGDRFTRQPVALTLRLPELICSPAATGGRTVAGSTYFLTCYRTVAKRFGTSVRVSDEFGRLRPVNLIRRYVVCVPSARVDQGGSTQASRSQDIFICYQATATHPITARRTSVTDAFATSTDTVDGPYRLCAPAASAGSRAVEPLSFLACYTVASATKGTTVVVKNELGLGYLKAALGPRGRLCVKATVT